MGTQLQVTFLPTGGEGSNIQVVEVAKRLPVTPLQESAQVTPLPRFPGMVHVTAHLLVHKPSHRWLHVLLAAQAPARTCRIVLIGPRDVDQRLLACECLITFVEWFVIPWFCRCRRYSSCPSSTAASAPGLADAGFISELAAAENTAEA